MVAGTQHIYICLWTYKNMVFRCTAIHTATTQWICNRNPEWRSTYMNKCEHWAVNTSLETTNAWVGACILCLFVWLKTKQNKTSRMVFWVFHCEWEKETTDITNPVTQLEVFLCINCIQTCQKWNLTWNKQTKFLKTEDKNKKTEETKRKITTMKRRVYCNKCIYVGKHYSFVWNAFYIGLILFFACVANDAQILTLFSVSLSQTTIYIARKSCMIMPIPPPRLLAFHRSTSSIICVSVFLYTVSYYLAIFHRLLYFA